MAKNDNDDTYDYEKTKPSIRKGKRDIEDSADSDRLPTLPNPGQVLLQKKRDALGQPDPAIRNSPTVP